MWFVGNGAARGQSVESQPWLVHLVWQLLDGDPSPEPLLARDPFRGGPPPRFIRAGIWRYRFSASRTGGEWWQRERVGEFFPPLSLDNRGLREYAAAYGWGRR
jgi:hypothetical protein